MTSEQAYQKYLIKVEGNATNDNIATDRGRFAIGYNESQNKYVEWLLDKRGEDDLRYIQKLLVKDKSILPTANTTTFYNFSLPPDYFDFVNVYALCSKGTCMNKKVDLFELEAESENEILQDVNNSPSFLWREAPFTLSSNAVKVYYHDFVITSIRLSYYRYAQQITLLDPDDPEGFFDESEELDFDDKLIDRILSLTAGEADLNNEDPFYQHQNKRATSKI